MKNITGIIKKILLMFICIVNIQPTMAWGTEKIKQDMKTIVKIIIFNKSNAALIQL